MGFLHQSRLLVLNILHAVFHFQGLLLCPFRLQPIHNSLLHFLHIHQGVRSVLIQHNLLALVIDLVVRELLEPILCTPWLACIKRLFALVLVEISAHRFALLACVFVLAFILAAELRLVLVGQFFVVLKELLGLSGWLHAWCEINFSATVIASRGRPQVSFVLVFDFKGFFDVLEDVVCVADLRFQALNLDLLLLHIKLVQDTAQLLVDLGVQFLLTQLPLQVAVHFSSTVLGLLQEIVADLFIVCRFLVVLHLLQCGGVEIPDILRGVRHCPRLLG